MKIDRRDWLIGAGSLLAAAAAFKLTPRNTTNLMGNLKLEGGIPKQFGDWAEDPGMGVVMPPREGSLADQLYDQLFSRAYVNRAAQDRPPVMLFASHGSTQSDALQLHRPEVCYPAIGFTMTGRSLVSLPAGNGVMLPVVNLTMQFGERVEDILYWTRIGDSLPQDGTQQRIVRMKEALKGTVSDGLLLRISAVRMVDEPALHGGLAEFARGLVAAVDPRMRQALIGREYARGLGG